MCSYPFLIVLGDHAHQGHRLGVFHRRGVSRRPVLRLAVSGRAVWQGVRRLSWHLPFVSADARAGYAVVGMSGLAVAIVGGPMTMTFLALESTRQFRRDHGGAGRRHRRRHHRAAAVRLFLRHLALPSARRAQIRRAVDVGWIHALTVGRMMRRAAARCARGMARAAFRQEVPLGATQRVVVTDDDGPLCRHRLSGRGLRPRTGRERVARYCITRTHFLLPGMNVKEALGGLRDGGGGCAGGAGRGRNPPRFSGCSPSNTPCAATTRSWTAPAPRNGRRVGLRRDVGGEIFTAKYKSNF